MTASIPERGRLAGIDYGTVRIGVALSDPDRILASPCANYTRRGSEADAQFFRQLVAQERLVGFIVGLPVHLSGDENQKSCESRKFGQWLHEVTNLPVEFYDERYTTAEAESFLLGANVSRKKRKQRLDKVAAQVLLAAYLESGPQIRSSPPQSLDDGR
jgi:putative Holliday junction resolvase